MLARAAVVQLVGVSNEAIVFGRTDKGKPYLVSYNCAPIKGIIIHYGVRGHLQTKICMLNVIVTLRGWGVLGVTLMSTLSVQVWQKISG